MKNIRTYQVLHFYAWTRDRYELTGVRPKKTTQLFATMDDLQRLVCSIIHHRRGDPLLAQINDSMLSMIAKIKEMNDDSIPRRGA